MIRRTVRKISHSQRKHGHLDAIMSSLVANPVHVVGLASRLVDLLPGAVAGLRSCGLAEEADLVTQMFLAREEAVAAPDLVFSVEALLRIQFMYRYSLRTFRGCCCRRNNEHSRS